MPTPSLVQMISSDSNYYGAGVPTAGIGGTGGQNNFRYKVPNKTQAGNCYLVSATWPDGNTPVLSDNLNGVWPAPIGTVGVGQGNNVSGFFLLIGSLPGWMTITGMLNGMPTPPWQWNIKEFCHIIGSGGTSAGAYAQTGPNLTAGSFTPSNNNSGGGNLIVTYCCTSGANMVQTTAPSSFVPSSGHTLLEANITCIEVQASGGYGFAHAEEYYLQTTAAAINPGFTATGDTTNTYNVIAIALTAGPAGSPAPAYGPWINKIIHQSTLADAALTSVKFQVPWTGNLRFARALTGGNLAGLTLTDSDSYTWTNEASATGDLMGWAANTAADTNATLTIAGTAGSFGGGYTWVFYDIANMATSPFDQYVSNTTYSTGNGGIPSNYGSLINVPTITPGVNYGLCISATGLGMGPGLTCSSPQGAVDDFMHYSGQNDNDNYDNADCGGHIDFRTDAPINWCYTITPGAGYTDGSYAITFAAATLPAPTGSSGSGVASSMRDPDLAIHAWWHPAVLPIIEWFDRNEPEGVAAVALRALGMAAANSLAGLRGVVSLLGSGKGSAEGLVSFSGKVPVITRATSLAMARAQAGAIAALAAKANALAKANANLQGAVPLAARGTGFSAARASPSGVVGLLARGVAAAMARAGIGTGAVIYLLARTLAVATGLARPAGKLGLNASGKAAGSGTATSAGTVGLFSRGMAAAKASLSGTWRLALSARGSGAAKSFASTSGIVGLIARGTMAAAGNATIRIGAFVNLVARGFTAAMGSAHATGKLGLTAAGQAIATARAAPGGAVGLLARTAAASKAAASIRIGAFVNLVARGFAAAMGTARASGKLALIATGKGTAAAIAAPAGAVGLLARTIAASKAATAGTWRAALAAHSSGAAKSFASARGIVGLLARGAAAAMANARIGTGVGNFVHLLARGFAAAAGAAHATGKVGLVASSNAAAAGQAAPGGAVGLLAFTAAASKALAFLAPVLDLRLVRFLTGRASAGAIDGKEG